MIRSVTGNARDDLRPCTHPVNERIVTRPGTRMGIGEICCGKCKYRVDTIPPAKSLQEEIFSVTQHLLDMGRRSEGTYVVDAYTVVALKGLLEELRQSTAPPEQENRE